MDRPYRKSASTAHHSCKNFDNALADVDTVAAVAVDVVVAGVDATAVAAAAVD